jgi:hypothetical protein
MDPGLSPNGPLRHCPARGRHTQLLAGSASSSRHVVFEFVVSEYLQTQLCCFGLISAG